MSNLDCNLAEEKVLHCTDWLLKTNRSPQTPTHIKLNWRFCRVWPCLIRKTTRPRSKRPTTFHAPSTKVTPTEPPFKASISNIQYSHLINYFLVHTWTFIKYYLSKIRHFHPWLDYGSHALTMWLCQKHVNRSHARMALQVHEHIWGCSWNLTTHSSLAKGIFLPLFLVWSKLCRVSCFLGVRSV